MRVEQHSGLWVQQQYKGSGEVVCKFRNSTKEMTQWERSLDRQVWDLSSDTQNPGNKMGMFVCIYNPSAVEDRDRRIIGVCYLPAYLQV